jgi:hypothetical protein
MATPAGRTNAAWPAPPTDDVRHASYFGVLSGLLVEELLLSVGVLLVVLLELLLGVFMLPLLPLLPVDGLATPLLPLLVSVPVEPELELGVFELPEVP